MTAFPGESVACPWCGVEAGRKCLTVDGRHQFASHSRRIHLEATRDNACDECGAPAGSNCVAQNRFSRARAHAVRVQAHLQRWEQGAAPAEVDPPVESPPVGEQVGNQKVDPPVESPPVGEQVGNQLAGLSERDLKVLAFIQRASEALGGQPPELDQSQMQSDIPMPKNTLTRALQSLRTAGVLNWGESRHGRRGPRVYYLVGQQMEALPRRIEIRAAPSFSGGSSGGSNGSGSKEGGSLKEPVFEDENIRSSLPGSGTRDDFDAPLDAPPAELNVCPLHRDPTCVAPTRYWNLKSAGDARGDLIVYCWGDNFKCSWVHSRLYGEIVEAGLHRLSDQDLTSRYYDVAAAAFAAAATSASDPRRSHLEIYRQRFGGYPCEVDEREKQVLVWPDVELDPVRDPTSHTGPGRPRPDGVSAWQAALGRLQLEIPQEQFNTFLRPCTGLGWQGNCLFIGAPTTFAVSWLELPLHLEMIREAVAKTVGAESSVRFISPMTRRNHEQSE